MDLTSRMNDISAFFGKGYKNVKREKPKLKSSFPEVKPSDKSNIAVNIMGNLYEGMDKIEFHEGDIFIDGNKCGKLPVTSGTWVKILKGRMKKNKIIEKTF